MPVSAQVPLVIGDEKLLFARAMTELHDIMHRLGKVHKPHLRFELPAFDFAQPRVVSR